jgi:GDPmannose 4,6-dehydratase
MKKAFITGITGQDGAYLSKFLLKKGYRVFGIVREKKRTNYWNLKYLEIVDKIDFIAIDLTNTEKVKQVLKDIKPDEIYNLAAQSSVAKSFVDPDSTIRFNVISTLNLLEIIRTLNLKSKYYQASSSEMFGKVKNLPVTEETVLHPVSPYAISKASSHWLAVNYREAYGLFCCCGILFNHESVLRPNYFVTKKIITTAVRIYKGSKEKLYLGNIDIERDWGYAPEYIKTMWLMLQQDVPDEYVIASNELHSLKDFVKLAFKGLKLNWREHTVIDKKLYRPSDIAKIYGNPEKAKRQFKWKYSITFEKLIQKLVNEEIKILEK